MKVPVTFYALIARIVNSFLPIKKKHWVFGADYGDSFREGAKYLLEYMLNNHQDYTCTFLTDSKKLKHTLETKGIPCQLNSSLNGMLKVAQAEVVITSRTVSDVVYAFRKKGRRFYYVLHGMPLKIAANALPKEYIQDNIKKAHGLVSKISSFILPPLHYEDSEFVAVTSDFLKQYEEKDMDYRVPVKVLGMPRNDVLFDDKKMRQEEWLDGLDNKFVITYMPTHRKYGHGEVSPSPFINRPDYQEWMRKNGVVLLVKQHPNMIPKLKDVKQTDVIRDITCDSLDPQVCIYHSDVLITDFSSVWMDYLLLRRPILFYIYDNFEQDDAGCHYDIREDPPGHFCETEDELFELIKNCKEDYDRMKPSDRIVHKYHKYVDGNSCERYFNAIVNG